MAVRGRLRTRKPSRRRCKPSPQARTCRRRRSKGRRLQPCPCRKPTRPICRHRCRCHRPAADAAQNPVAPPLANPTPTTGGGAGQQSLLNDPAAPFAMAASMPAAADAEPGRWIRRRMDDGAGDRHHRHAAEPLAAAFACDGPGAGDRRQAAGRDRRTGTARSGARGRRLGRLRGCRPLRRWPAGSGEQRGSRALVRARRQEGARAGAVPARGALRKRPRGEERPRRGARPLPRRRR